MQHTHTHKAVTGRVEAKKLLSRRRPSNYRWFKYLIMTGCKANQGPEQQNTCKYHGEPVLVASKLFLRLLNPSPNTQVTKVLSFPLVPKGGSMETP